MDQSHDGEWLVRNRQRPASMLEAFDLLGKRKHLEILILLAHGPMTVSGIAHVLEYVEPDVSRLLKDLREHGLVQERHVRKAHVQSLAPAGKLTLNGQSVTIEIFADDGAVVSARSKLDKFLLERLRRLKTLPGIGHNHQGDSSE